MAVAIWKTWSDSTQLAIKEALGKSGNADRHRLSLLFEPQDFQREFYYSQSKIKCAFWGNQSGKSACLANMLRNFVTCDYPDEWPEKHRFEPPTIGRLWIPSFSGVKSVFLPKWYEWLDNWPADHRSNDFWKISRNQGGQIAEVSYTPNGSMFDVASSEQFDQNPMIGEGWQGHYSIADEPLRRGAFDATMRGLMIRGGPFIFGGTLLTEPWMTRSFVRRQRQGHVECYYASTDDNLQENGGYLPREDFDAFLENLTEREEATRRHGTPAAMLGTYFPQLSEPETADKVFVPCDPPIDPSWEVVSITDYHVSTPTHTIYMAVTPFGQMVFFAELIQGSVAPIEYVKLMLRTEQQWGIKRLRGRYVDRAIDVNYTSEFEDKQEMFNPYHKFNEHFSTICSVCIQKPCVCGRRASTPAFAKVTNAQGNIEVVRSMMDPVYCPALDKEIQPFVIGHHCAELIDTLPDATPAVYRSGPMAGESKEEMDKRKIKGAHSVDTFLYGIGLQLRYEDLEVMAPPPGTYGYMFHEMAQQDEDEASFDIAGSTVGVRR